MIEMVAGSFLILFAVFVLTLQQLYGSVPIKELRRLARFQDPWYQTLYRPVAYGRSLRLLLWIAFCLSLPAGVALIVSHISLLLSFVILAALAIVLFVLVPSVRLTTANVRVAVVVAPSLAKLLAYTYPALSKLAGTDRQPQDVLSSNLYEKEDLIDLLNLQKQQPHNRMSPDDLEAAQRSLLFTSKHARDILRPRKELTLVNTEDNVGPVLLDQLHASGQYSWLVYEGKKSNIIGSLHLHDAQRVKEGCRVLDLIHNDLIFVHEDFTLRQVVAAFRISSQHMAVVINKFEEFLGIVTLEDLMLELLGETSTTEVPEYDSREAVAAYEPLSEVPAVQPADETTLTEATEVVE